MYYKVDVLWILLNVHRATKRLSKNALLFIFLNKNYFEIIVYSHEVV